MILGGHQINPIDVNFQLQKSLEIFDKNSADKILSKQDRGWKVPSLMPIRVKRRNQNDPLQADEFYFLYGMDNFSGSYGV